MEELSNVVAENKKTAEKYIKEGSVGMLIFGFFLGWIKAFLYMFVALFKGAGGGDSMGGLFRFFRAIIETVLFPFIYAFRVGTKKKQKKQAEAIIESDAQILKSVLENGGVLSQEELREKIAQVVSNSEILISFDKSKK